MAYEGAKVLVVVPARGGSKGIPAKNLREVGGISLVGRAAQVAAGLEFVDAAVISTDDPEIRQEAVRHGLSGPFLRPKELASDTARSADMWKHAWLASEAHFDTTFDVSLLLEPTSPLRRAEDIERVMRALMDSGAPAAVTVSRTPAHFTPHKTLTMDSDSERLGFYLGQGDRYSLRQAIPAYFHRNGLCYAATRPHLVDRGHVLNDETVGVVVDREVVNIDEPFELEYAEWLLARQDSSPA